MWSHAPINIVPRLRGDDTFCVFNFLTCTEAVHQKLLTLVKHYMVLGGMPAVLSAYLSTSSHGTHILHAAELQQTILLATYRHQDYH